MKYNMKTPETSTLFLTTGFLLSKIGKEITECFAERIAPLGLRPKHCGLLAAVKAFPPMSQQELGKALGLVPSAIVTSLDELKALHAIARVEDPKDRRRYTIQLTARGETLLRKATKLALDIDNEMMAGLSKAERAGLTRSLQGIAEAIGVISDQSRTSLS
jgi:DNA-binding MarR family transcriptional regulator